MASIPYAFSEELNEIVSAEDAFDFYWQGKLKEKKRFQCPGNNCSAQVTCANMDKEEVELKQSPNFRVYGTHAELCEYINFLEVDGHSLTSSTLTESNVNNCAEFITKRSTPILEKESSDDTNKIGRITKKVNDGYSKYSYRPKYFSIRPLVDRFFEYHEEDLLKDRFVKIDSKTWSYSSLFKRVYKLDSKFISENENAIFWGLASVKETRNGSFQIKFWGKITHEGKEYSPSTFIKRTQIEKYIFNKRLNKYLNSEFVKNENVVVFFVFGKPYLVPSQKYVNIDVENLDYIDFKSKDYFEKMKRKFS